MLASPKQRKTQLNLRSFKKFHDSSFQEGYLFNILFIYLFLFLNSLWIFPLWYKPLMVLIISYRHVGGCLSCFSLKYINKTKWFKSIFLAIFWDIVLIKLMVTFPKVCVFHWFETPFLRLFLPWLSLWCWYNKNQIFLLIHFDRFEFRDKVNKACNTFRCYIRILYIIIIRVYTVDMFDITDKHWDIMFVRWPLTPTYFMTSVSPMST